MPKRTTIRLQKQPTQENSKLADVLNKIMPTTFGALLGYVIIPGIGGLIVGALTPTILFSPNQKKMQKIPVFYSFHFDNDVMRVQQIRNIGSIEGNPPTTPNEWERLKRTGERAIQNWIQENMKYKRCIIVLIGTDTANRPWVKYEIEKAWNEGKALLGIHIHNLKCPRTGTSRKGRNPFDEFSFNDGRKLSSVVPCHDPNPSSAYRDIANNIGSWIQSSITNKRN